MNWNFIGAIVPIVVTALLLLGTEQSAVARGNGIKAGSGRLHPAIDLELMFDSNPGYFSSSNENKAYDLMLRIRPGLTLELPSDSVSLELNGKVGYDYFFGLDNKSTRDLSTISGDANLRVGFNPHGQFAFFLIDAFSRTGDPRYTSLAQRFDRTDNEVKALFQIKPGGGALLFDLAYGFFIDWFDDTGPSAQALSSYGHRIYFSGKWKFLPKTAVSLDFDADLRRYPNAYDDGSENPDVNAIRATVGMIGQISPSISVVVKAGYGDSLLSGGITSAGQTYSGADFRSVIAQAEMSYRAATTFIQLGYLRNFQPVVGFAYFGQDRIYARARQQLMGRLTVSADFGFDFLNYGDSLVGGSEDRLDYLLVGGATVEYHILDWLAVALSYNFQSLFGDYVQPGGASIEYNKHAISFRVGIDY